MGDILERNSVSIAEMTERDGRAHLLALLLLVFSLVLPNLVWAKVAVVKVSGVVVRGMKVGTGDGEPLKELAMDVGDGAVELEFR